MKNSPAVGKPLQSVSEVTEAGRVFQATGNREAARDKSEETRRDKRDSFLLLTLLSHVLS